MRISEIFFVGLEFVAVLTVISLNCCYGGPGWVDKTTVNGKINSSFKISCSLNETFFKINQNESCQIEDMFFRKNTGGKYIDLMDVKKENTTTISYTVENAEMQESIYICMCNVHAIMQTNVYIGTEPQKIEDFQCYGYDYLYMVCNFTSQNNTLATTYSLSYATKDSPNYIYDVDCIKVKPWQQVCNTTHEKYRTGDPIFNFKLRIKNAVGELEQLFPINNHRRMIPARPGEGLVVNNKSTNSICLTWEMQRRIFYRRGLLWQVQVTPMNLSSLHRDMWRNSSSDINISLCLDDLEYAGYKYKLELRVRVNASGTVWSEPFIYNFQTEPERPRRPPLITNGSFYVYSSETQLRLYWEDLKRYEYNGENFGYVISEYRKDGQLMDASNITVESNSALIGYWQMGSRYDIYIRSHNKVNDSVEASRMVIMPISDLEFNARKPQNILSVYHPDNSSYTLSWRAPIREEELLNYTVYWCNSKRALQVECEGSIHFVDVPSSQLSYTTTPLQNQSLNMAVSANFEHFNTGMHWPICTMDITSDLARMEPTIDEKTNSSLFVKWSNERVCPAILTAYNLTYCEIVGISSQSDPNCTTVKIDNRKKSYRIENLKPFTKYTVKIFMYSETKASKYSDEISAITDEAAPTKPGNLNFTQVTNTSVTLKWDRPNVANGIIRGYSITINDSPYEARYPVDGSNDSLNSITYKYSGLKPYTAYKVVVRAYTQYYSEPSDSIHFNTTVGNPSKPDVGIFTGNEKPLLNWTEPSIPAGPVHYYEVAIREINGNGTVVREDTSYIQNRECHFVTPDCKPTHKFEYRVRAVNVELVSNELIDSQQNNSESESHYVEDSGNLKCVSDELESYNLQKKYRNSNMYLLYKSEWGTYPLWCSERTSHLEIFVLVSFFVIMSSVFAMHMARKKYNKMADIDLTLPSGMESLYTKPAIDIGSTGEDDGTNPGGFTQSPPSWKCTMNDGDRNLQMFIPQTQLETNCGNENSKLLFSAAATVNHGHVGLPYVDEPHGNDELNPGLSYTRMNSDSTTDTLIDNEHNVVTQGAPASQYKKASEFTGTRLVTPDPITADAKGMGMGDGGYIKPANMLDMWHPWDDVSHSNAVTHGNGSSAMNIPKAPNVPTGGYVTVQNLQTPNVQTQKPNLTAVPSMQPTHLSGAILSTNGYVQAADLQKLVPKTNLTNVVVNPIESKPLVNASGYTTMEHLANASRTNVTANAAVTTTPFKFPTCTNGEQVEAVYGMESAAKPISGYVTQQDLNILAKHHQQQHQVL